MKNITKYLLMAFAVISMASCSVSGPLFITDNPGGPNAKTGESSYKVILGFPPFNGDASIASACKQGGITKVSTVDMKVKGGLFVMTVSTIVTGE